VAEVDGMAVAVGALLGAAPALGEGDGDGVAVALMGGITKVSGVEALHDIIVLHTMEPPSSSASVAFAVLPALVELKSGSTCTMVGRAAPPTGHSSDALVSPVEVLKKLAALPSTAASGMPLDTPAEGPAMEDAMQRCSSMTLGPHSVGSVGEGAPANASSSPKDSTQGDESVPRGFR
jgi:hypothetical protein